jgi:hypothetical protein
VAKSLRRYRRGRYIRAIRAIRGKKSLPLPLTDILIRVYSRCTSGFIRGKKKPLPFFERFVSIFWEPHKPVVRPIVWLKFYTEIKHG